MARVVLQLGGRDYALACRDGDETRLVALGTMLAQRARGLDARLGAMGEADRLLGVAILLADELTEAQAALLAAAERVEALAGALESEAGLESEAATP